MFPTWSRWQKIDIHWRNFAMPGSLTRTSLDEFLAQPVGRYFAGESYIGWTSSPTFSGGAAWGRPTLEEVASMVRGHDWHESAGHQPPIDVLIDAGDLEHISLECFAAYVKAIVPRVPFYARFIRRQALVVPRGMVGAIVAGFYPMVGKLVPKYRLFDHPDEAFGWLGQSDAQPVVAAAIASCRDTPLLSQLRRALMQSHCLLDLETAATRLGVSERTLQRALIEAHTTFRGEKQQVRLQLALTLLEQHPDLKLDAIADRLGLASTSHFCIWFRNRTGSTPSQWRDRAVELRAQPALRVSRPS